VSKNTKLVSLACLYNKLTAAELNTMFNGLPTRSVSDNATVYIYGNPGTATCNKKTATDKGWSVVDNGGTDDWEPAKP